MEYTALRVVGIAPRQQYHLASYRRDVQPLRHTADTVVCNGGLF